MNNHPFIQELHTYCETHSSPQSALLHELERETHLKTLAPQMMSGHLQGRFLSLISKLIQPSAILEIGTFTGYAALCLAEGLREGGVLHTIEVEAELEPFIRKYIQKAGFEDRIQLHIGQAGQVIPTLDLSFDLVWIDAGKTEYALYYDLVFDKVNPGGLILADNVLWSGKVLEEADKEDQDTRAIQAFNRKVLEDDRAEKVMLPLRDGILIARKLS